MRVAELVPAGYNPRKITARAADGLRASLARFGELGGIVWNERTRRLVGGHQRVKALLALGVEEVDVRVVDLPTAEEKALNVTLNNPAISGEFDFEVLDVVLDDIRSELPNAFEELHLEDIRPLFAPSTGGDSSAAPGHGGGSDAEATNSRNESQNLTKGLTDPDETPEPAPEPVTRAGDVWVLGDHRIICGDSTVARDVAALIPAGTRAALLHADPPYGMGKEADGVKNDNLYAGKLDVFQMAWWRTWRPFLADNASAYVWNFDRVTGAERHGHATPKPVAMIVRAIKSSCPEGGVVLEPFNGSGTTLIAAETCGRVCYAAELTPTYVDTTVRRWQAFTGKQAVLDGDGRTFDDIAVDRGVEAAGGTRG